MLVLDTNGNVLQAGSSEGNQFLCCNAEIGIKFREHFGMMYINLSLFLPLTYRTRRSCLSQLAL